MQDRILPHNEDSEKIVLGSILSDVNAFAEVRSIVTPEMFYNSFHAELFREILNLSKQGKAPDIVLLSEKYKHDTNSVLKIADISGFFSPDYYEHALNVQEKHVRRLLWKIGSQLASDIFSHTKETDTILNDLQRELGGIYQSITQASITSFSDAVKGVYRQIENNLNGEHLTGTDTGFHQINKATGGLQKSDLIIIAGETSQGKTSLALSFIDKAAKSGEAIAVYSLEMKKEQLTARILSMNTGVPSNQILFSQLDTEYLEILDKGINRLGNLPIYYDDNSTSNIDKIIASIRVMKQKFNISGAVVDYLQILNVNQQRNMTREQAMGDAARRLKNLAKDLDIWIIALSQLNRNDANPVPNLNRLRDSGQIAEAADIVIFVYRPEVYGRNYPEPFTKYSTKGTAMIHIAKGRNIGLLKFICAFDAKTTHFKDLGDEVPEAEEERYF